MAYSINSNCTGCARCVACCPTEAIEGAPGEPHAVVPELCVDCGACGPVCAEGAVIDHLGVAFPALRIARGPRARVELQVCEGCGWCQTACLFDALELGPGPEGRDSRVAVVHERRCVGCALCELECPHGAIRVYRGDEPRERPRDPTGAAA